MREVGRIPHALKRLKQPHESPFFEYPKFALHENSQKVLDGEKGSDKIAKEVGVKKGTVYVVKSELKRHMSGKPSNKEEASGKTYW